MNLRSQTKNDRYLETVERGHGVCDLVTGALVVGGMVVGSEMSNSGSANAGQATQDAANTADPFRQYRPMYGQQMNQFMSNPSAYLQDPTVQARYNMGLDAVNRTEAAKHMLGSGNRLTDLTQFGQTFASNEIQNQFDRLATLSGASSGSPATAGNLLLSGEQQQYKQQQQSYQDLGSMMGMMALMAA